jgi:hypothetical protein
MAERLPIRGETPYYDILVPWLKVSLNDDGTLKSLLPSLTLPMDLTGTGVKAITSIGGQANVVGVHVQPTASGSVQQGALHARIDGTAAGGSTVFRLAGIFEAQTGGGVGANGVEALNLAVQQNAADDVAFLTGIELAFNNLKRDDPLDPVDQNHYGITIDAYGGFSIGPAALAIRKGAASSTWQRGLWIPVNSITPATGLAIDYAGNGAGRKFQVDEAANVFVGNALKFPTAGVAPSAGIALYNNGGVSLTIVGGTTNTKFFSNNLGAELFTVNNNGEIGLGGISASTWILSKAATSARSSLRAPHGSAPSAPVDGDIWTTTAGLFVRVNGVTVGPLS